MAFSSLYGQLTLTKLAKSLEYMNPEDRDMQIEPAVMERIGFAVKSVTADFTGLKLDSYPELLRLA